MSCCMKYDSPLGTMTMYSEDGEKLYALWFDRQKYDRSLMDEAEQPVEREMPVFLRTKEWLDLYFEGKDPGFLPPLELTGSDFRRMVSREMLKIPFGQTTTYGRIAETVAEKTGKDRVSAQAVGGAVGHNPLTIIVPCHRVVGKNGSLTGYAGGIDKKIKLLQNEGVDIADRGLFVPENLR